MYDIIGDIHGHADALEALLKKLGYENSKGYYSHPERKVIFVGDFIDRGPKIIETLSIVKSMTDNNAALATMGNHEFNILCFHTKNAEGEYLRQHSDKNTNQIRETIEQFRNHESEWKSYLDWFRELPVYLELGDLRVIHATWDPENIKAIPDGLKFTEEFLIELHSEKGTLYNAIDESLKGTEHKLEKGTYFYDRQGNKRDEMRIKWYLDPAKSKYEDYFMEDIPELKGKNVDVSSLKKTYYYGENEKPVFCGHYWFSGVPAIETKNVACVDYSIGKDGKLVAYRWNGESELTNEGFVWVD